MFLERFQTNRKLSNLALSNEVVNMVSSEDALLETMKVYH